MDKTRQELIQAARHKLDKNGRYSLEQREQIVRTLDLLLELARTSDKTEENARATARLLANVTNHHNLVAIIQQQAAELDALKRISFNLTASLEIQTVLDAIVTEAMQLIKDARDAHIFLYQDGTLRFGASLDSEGKRNAIFAMPRPNGLTYSVARSRETIIAEDVRKHPLFLASPPDWDGSIAGIPLRMGTTTVIGVMNMARWSIGGFSPSELRLLELLADQAALAIINARLHQAVANEAMSDSLTGLPNRRALDARLENDVQRAGRQARKFSVLMMDLDGFKTINDTFGHAVGDEVLQQFARFLIQSQRTSDFLARYGGDELTMILPETDLEGAQTVAENIRDRMSQFEVALPGELTRVLSVSGGIAVFPTHARSASDLLRAADEALYRAKRHGRGAFVTARAGGTSELPPLKNLK